MRQHELKYAALSTYRTTVFIKRTGDYRFELSMPVDEKATNPSLRECFLALCALASQEPEYIESPEFCIETVGQVTTLLMVMYMLTVLYQAQNPNPAVLPIIHPAIPGPESNISWVYGRSDSGNRVYPIWGNRW